MVNNAKSNPYKKHFVLKQGIIDVYSQIKNAHLNTICQEANCPNIGECWLKGKVTFLILGNICTRNCAYCGVKKNKIGQDLNFDEIIKISKAIKKQNLKSIVMTSVTRDDLKDHGSSYYKKAVNFLKSQHKNIKVEILTPDFGYKESHYQPIITCKADILSHNLELTQSVYHKYRPEGAYQKSLELLTYYSKAKKIVKSAIMLGFGETWQDIYRTVQDLAKVGIDYLCIGQYMPPSKFHIKPKKYYKVQEFADLRKFIQNNFNFKKLDISPYSRSSFLD